MIPNRFGDTNIYHPQKLIYISRKKKRWRVVAERGGWRVLRALTHQPEIRLNTLESAFPYY